jgi:serine/threonine protein kinase
LPDRKTVVAIKRLHQDSSQGIKELRAEINTLGRLKHRNLVNLIGSYISETEALLIYEFLSGGDLDSYLFGDKKIFKEWSVRHNVLLGSARGFKYLHHDNNPAVIHRDIKPPNILLDDDVEPRVADFGLAKEINILIL